MLPTLDGALISVEDLFAKWAQRLCVWVHTSTCIFHIWNLIFFRVKRVRAADGCSKSQSSMFSTPHVRRQRCKSQVANPLPEEGGHKVFVR